jgi:PiT family inorganic phosphate transporter
LGFFREALMRWVSLNPNHMNFLADITLFSELSNGTLILLGLALLLALSFEFVNGFHDTANAVATVIYTHTLPAVPAVIWSGFFNFLGVLTSSGAVAFGIVNLLPAELVIQVGSAAGFAMVFSLLVSAILWNVGTWFLGLPASSSHTLIGSIIGVGVANAVMGPSHYWGDGVNWAKAKDVGLALLISPAIGFCVAALLLIVMKILIRNPKLYSTPDANHPPPGWIRALLMFTCTGVSFAHGSNDGQKGMGLIMLILVGIIPATFALKPDSTAAEIQALRNELASTALYCNAHAGSAGDHQLSPITSKEAVSIISEYMHHPQVATPALYQAISTVVGESQAHLSDVNSLSDIPVKERGGLRSDLYLLSTCSAKLVKNHQLDSPAAEKNAKSLTTTINSVTNYIPVWVKVAVAFALGLGTMVGWKRIVVTVGERIGKSHLTYGQGAAAELVAMLTISMADVLGLPASTTHVLSSGVAGTMAANGSGLQMNTVRNILLAWVLTLPVCVFLGASLFALGLNLMLRLGGG